LLVEFEIFQILINFKIKNPKKLAFIFRILIKTEFKNSLSFILKNSSKFVQPLKVKKKKFWLVPFNPGSQGPYPLAPLPLSHPRTTWTI
jgi:hypothetical protein